MPAGVNNMLSDYKADYLLNALMTNPNAAFFPWNCGDFPFATFPNGVPRANVVTAYNNKASIDAAKGASFAVLYNPGMVRTFGVSQTSGTLAQVQNSFPNTAPLVIATPGATPNATPTVAGGSNSISDGGIVSGAFGPIVTQQSQVA